MSLKQCSFLKIKENAGDNSTPSILDEEIERLLKITKFPESNYRHLLEKNVLSNLCEILYQQNIKTSHKQTLTEQVNNTSIRSSKEKLIFRTKNFSEINFERYYCRIMKYLKPEISTLIISVIYLDKITCNSKMKGFLSENTIHRLFFSLLIMAIKFNEDNCHRALFLSRVSGISVKRLIKMEATLCQILDFQFYIDEEIYNLYYKELLYVE